MQNKEKKYRDRLNREPKYIVLVSINQIDAYKLQDAATNASINAGYIKQQCASFVQKKLFPLLGLISTLPLRSSAAHSELLLDLWPPETITNKTSSTKRNQITQLAYMNCEFVACVYLS